MTASGSYQFYTVPSNVNLLYVKLWGAGGGGSLWSSYSSNTFGGGAGGFSSCHLIVVPGEVLRLVVGEGGQGGTSSNVNGVNSRGGFAGGGNSRNCGASNGGGGGRSSIQSRLNDLAEGVYDDIVTAGGIYILLYYIII